MAEIRGSDNSETLNGTAENDEIRSGDGDDTVYGNEGDDWINAIYNDEGDDRYYVYSGRLIALGGPGNDLIGGKEGNDRLYGGVGNDRIYAWAGDDLLDGGDGDDHYNQSRSWAVGSPVSPSDPAPSACPASVPFASSAGI